MRTLISILVAFCLSLHTYGQAVRFDFDKKIITTDSLNLQRNTSASTLIRMLPELVQRPGTYIFDNYDIQINGMSVGSANDVALYQLHIDDIEKIEINESPISSYQKNGQGGTIDIILRTSGEYKTDTWGSAGLIASTATTVAPHFNIGYKKNKFLIHGIMFTEFYDTSNNYQTQTFDHDQFLSQSTTDIDSKFRSQLLRAYMQYEFTPKDLLKFNVSEIYTYSKEKEIDDYAEDKAVSSTEKSTNLHAFLEYKHKFSKGNLTAKLEYKYIPSRNDYNKGVTYIHNGKLNTQNLSGQLEYKNTLFSSVSAKGTVSKGEITVGTNFNNTYGSETTLIKDQSYFTPEEMVLTPQNNTYYLMPYLTLNGSVGRLRLKLTTEFQHFKYDLKRNDTPHTSTSNDFTGKFMAEWHFTPANNMRLILDRKLQRPSSDQLFPFLLYDQRRGEYVQGNPDLTPMMSHEAKLEYLGNYRLGGYHKLTINAGLSFNKITDIVKGGYTQDNGNNNLSSTLHHLMFENNGNSNISNVNLMALYNNRAFTVSLSGNMYYRKNNDSKAFTYYNISLHPQFNLKDGWTGGAYIVYYSRVNQPDGYIGDCASSVMTVGKKWKKFYFYLCEDISILKKSKDVTYFDTFRTETPSLMKQSMQNYVGGGVKFTF